MNNVNAGSLRGLGGFKAADSMEYAAVERDETVMVLRNQIAKIRTDQIRAAEKQSKAMIVDKIAAKQDELRELIRDLGHEPCA